MRRTAGAGAGAGRELLLALPALALVVLVGLVFNADGVFFLAATHADTLWAVAPFGVLACGMTIVIVTGGIDLSVGSVVALSGIAFALMTMRASLPGAVAVPAAIAVGTLCGAVSGSLAGLQRIQPFIATLRGLAKELAGGVKIRRTPPPDLIEAINRKLWIVRDAEDPTRGFYLAASLLVFALCAAVTAFVLRASSLGVRLYAVGDNETAARYAGLPVRRVKLLAYALGGTFAGVAGVLFCGLHREGNPDMGVGYELTAIAMVVIGGTPLSGGAGGIGLTLVGALTVSYLQKILDINSVPTSYQLMITGGIIILAVLAQRLRARAPV